MDCNSVNNQIENIFFVLPNEIKMKILSKLPFSILLNSMGVCQDFKMIGAYILNSNPNKLDLVQALFNEKCYKTAFLAIERFALNEKLIREKFIQKFNQASSANDFSSLTNDFCVIGLLTASSNKELNLQMPDEHQNDASFSYYRLKNLSISHLQRLKSFLRGIESDPAFIGNALPFELASLLYNLQTILYDQNLSKEIGINEKTLAGLANSENLTLFIGYLSAFFERKLALQPKDDSHTNEMKIYELAQRDPLVALCELLTDRNSQDEKKAFNPKSTMHKYLASDQELVYKLFNFPLYQKETLKDYISIIYKEGKTIDNLRDIIESLYKETLFRNDKNASIIALEWLITINKINHNFLSSYEDLFISFTKKYTFTDWSILLALLSDKQKVPVLNSLINVCLSMNTKSHFADALYAMRLLDPYAYQSYQDAVIQCLIHNHIIWKDEGLLLPEDLQEDFGGLIYYILEKETKNPLEYLDFVNNAEIVLHYLNHSQKEIYRPLIKNFINAKQAEMILLQSLPVEKAKDEFLDFDDFFDQNEVDYTDFDNLSSGSNSEAEELDSDADLTDSNSD